MYKSLSLTIMGMLGMALTHVHSMVFLGVAAVLINSILLCVPPVFIYCLIHYPKFALWVKALIEDGDDVPNKADAKDAVILFFAYIVGWALINLFLYSAMYDKDLTSLLLVVSGLFVALLGVSQVSNFVKKK